MTWHYLIRYGQSPAVLISVCFYLLSELLKALSLWHDRKYHFLPRCRMHKCKSACTQGNILHAQLL